MTIQQSRRTYIKIAAGTGVGFIIGVEFSPTPARAEAPFAPNPFVRIAPDNTVTALHGSSHYRRLAVEQAVV